MGIVAVQGRLFRLAAIGLIMSLAACSGGTSSFAPEPAASPLTNSTNPVTTGSYKLGSGDKVRVIVFGEDNLSGEFVVDDSGNVSLPLIGNVPARGQTVQGLQNGITSRYAAGYLKDPKVSIEVLNYRPFFITGEIKNGGEFPYKSGLTVQDAIAVAGGYTYRANTTKVFIRRAGRNGETAVDLSQRVPINPGDNIRVPERFF